MGNGRKLDQTMKDKGEFFLVTGSSGEYSSYELHPVNCFTSFEEADKCRADCEDQSLLLKEMRRILEHFGYTTFINLNGSELTYSPTFFIVESLITTIDPNGSIDTEYEVVKLPQESITELHLNQLTKSIEYVSSLLNKESSSKFTSGQFDRKGNPNQKIRLL